MYIKHFSLSICQSIAQALFLGPRHFHFFWCFNFSPRPRQTTTCRIYNELKRGQITTRKPFNKLERKQSKIERKETSPENLDLDHERRLENIPLRALELEFDRSTSAVRLAI